jgi:hypothetical protein
MAEQDPVRALSVPTPGSTLLDDKYTTTAGRVYLTGYQALVRLLMIQRDRDRAAGLNTAGFVSGYRGSPLGGLDQTLWKAKAHLASHDIVFQPGINEDMAATAVWGSQQVALSPKARVQGVFGMWYGKGPGVDRCGDVFRHANAAGSSQYGGVLVIAGDDHAAKSSTLPHQTDHFFKSMMMPVLAPAGVQDYLDFGVHGWALSRYSGCWVAFKALADTVETSASVDVDPLRVTTKIPDDFALPEGGLNIRWPDPPLVQEKRLLHAKLYAALAYCRANGLNRIVIDSPQPRLGIITSGKSYLDVRQAFDDLGIDEALAAEIGIRLYKVGMVWPLEAEGVRHFAEGLDEILVIEEKRQLLEYQLKEELYNWREDVRPRVVGKFDEKGGMVAAHHPGRGRPYHRRPRRMAAPRRRGADPGHDRPGHRCPHRALLHIRSHRGPPGLPPGQGGHPRPPRLRHRPGAHLLPGLPPQHLHGGARRQPRHGRHRLPLHGHLHARPQDRHLHPTWAVKACPGSARRPSSTSPTSLPTWATAPTSTRACWPSARRWQPSIAPAAVGRRPAASPTRSSSTTPWP